MSRSGIVGPSTISTFREDASTLTSFVELSPKISKKSWFQRLFGSRDTAAETDETPPVTLECNRPSPALSRRSNATRTLQTEPSLPPNSVKHKSAITIRGLVSMPELTQTRPSSPSIAVPGSGVHLPVSQFDESPEPIPIEFTTSISPSSPPSTSATTRTESVDGAIAAALVHETSRQEKARSIMEAFSLRKNTGATKYWMNDDDCPNCYECQVPFSILRRRHHCRACGQIFCGKCSNHFVAGMSFGYRGQVRVCNHCRAALAAAASSPPSTLTMPAYRSAAINTNGFGENPMNTAGANNDTTRPSTSTTPIPPLSRTKNDSNPNAPNQEASDSPSEGLFTNHMTRLPLYDEPPRPVAGEAPSGAAGVDMGDRQRAYYDGDHAAGDYEDDDEEDDWEWDDAKELRRRLAWRAVPANGSRPHPSPATSPPTAGGPLPSGEPAMAAASAAPANPVPTSAGDTSVNSGSSPSATSGDYYSLNGHPRKVPRKVSYSWDSLRLPETPSSTQGAAVASALSSSGALYAAPSLVAVQPALRDRHPASSPNVVAAPAAEVTAPAVGKDVLAVAAAAERHLTRLVYQVVRAEGLEVAKWAPIILQLCSRVCTNVVPNVAKGDRSDVREYVEIRTIAGAAPEDSAYIEGIAFAKNVAHKKMRVDIANPAVLLLGCSIEFLRDDTTALTSFDYMLKLERKQFRTIVQKIAALKPDVVLVEGTVARLAKDFLLEHGISLLQNVKRRTLDKVARLTNGDIATSTSYLDNTRVKLGTCASFRIHTFKGDWGRKTLAYLDGCPPTLGCTIVLRGGPREELKKAKRVLAFAVYAAYSIHLEQQLWIDHYATFIPAGDGEDPEDEPILSVSPTIRFPSGDRLLNPSRPCLAAASPPSTPHLVMSSQSTSPHGLLGLAGSRPQSPTASGDPGDDETENSANGGMGGGTAGSRSLKGIVFDCSVLQAGTAFSESQLLYGRSTGRSGPQDDVDHGDTATVGKRIAHAAGGQQYLLYQHALCCRETETQCLNYELHVADYYSENDLTLGQFLEIFCFNPDLRCRSNGCGRSMLDHERAFLHGNGRLNVAVCIMSTRSTLSTASDHILMWSVCKVCSQVTPFTPMSDATWRFSFGKYLELCFYSRLAVSRAVACGHGLVRSHTRYFLFRNMVASLDYEELTVMDVCVPPPIVAVDTADPKTRAVLRREADALLVTVHKVYDAILAKIAQLQREIADPELLKELGVKLVAHAQEKERFAERARAALSGQQPLDLFELNLWKRKLFVTAVTWCATLSELAVKNAAALVAAAEQLPTPLGSGRSHRRTMSTSGHAAGHYSATGGAPWDEDAIEGTALSLLAVECDRHHTSWRPQLIPQLGSSPSTATTALYVVTEAPPPSGDHDSGRRGSLKGGGSGSRGSTALRFERLQFDDLPCMVAPEARGGDSFPSLSSSPSGSGFAALAAGALVSPAVASATVAPATTTAAANGQAAVSQAAGVSTIGPPSKTPRQHTFLDQVRSFLPGSSASAAPLVNVLQGTNFFEHGLFLALGTDPNGGTHGTPIDIIVYPDEPSTVVAYTLCSLKYREQFAMWEQKLRKPTAAADVAVTSLQSSPAMQRSPSPGPYSSADGSAKEPLPTVGPNGGGDKADEVTSYSLLSHEKTHITTKFMDESVHQGTKVRMLCTAYYALQFAALRRQSCAGGELGFVHSLARCRAWEANGGKSGSLFSKTLDDRYILKQISKVELLSFLEFAPLYFEYISRSFTQIPTMLAKIVGVYTIKIKATGADGTRGLKQDVVVLENLFYNRKISKTFDLKGSLRSRYTDVGDTPNAVLMDENLLEYLYSSPLCLHERAKATLSMAVWNDTLFLSSLYVMDYSLLVGVDEEKKELVVGIIDYMRKYTWDKQLESTLKSTGLMGGRGKVPTIISPKQYKVRFRDAMWLYFLMLPNKFSKVRLLTQ